MNRYMPPHTVPGNAGKHISPAAQRHPQRLFLPHRVNAPDCPVGLCRPAVDLLPANSAGRIVVKGIGIEYLWQDTLILAIMGVITLVLAASRVRKSLANGKVGASCRLNRLFKSWKLVALG